MRLENLIKELEYLRGKLQSDQDKSDIDKLVDRDDQNASGGLSSLKRDIQLKQQSIEQESSRINILKDEIELNNGKVPKYHEQDCSQLCEAEEIEYLKSKNTLIEIEVTAKEGLSGIRKALEEI